MRALCFAVVASLFVTQVNAQVLQGRFVDSSGGPAIAALVTITDSAGRQTTALSDSTGAYFLHARQAGFHRLRVERIGFAPLSGGVVLTRGATALTDTLRIMSLEFGEIQPGNVEGCTGGDEVQSLWAEVRKALRTIALAEEQGFVRVSGIRYLRELHEGTRAQLAIIDQEAFADTGVPAREPPLDAPAGDWFAVADSAQPMYFAASARALASDEFARGHCFTSITVDANDVTHLGLVFEPRGDNTAIGLSGTAWVERGTGRLLMIQYGYRAGHGATAIHASGLVEFSILPNAVPHVARWWLQLPITRVVSDGAQRGSGEVRTIVEDGALVFNRSLTPISDPGNVMAALRGAYALDPIVVESSALTRRRAIVPTVSARPFDVLSDFELKYPAGTNAYEFIRSKRLRWLGYASERDKIFISVYVDGVRVNRPGEDATEALRQIPMPLIDAMQFLDRIEAPAYLGLGNHTGAILIVLKKH